VQRIHVSLKDETLFHRHSWEDAVPAKTVLE